MTAYAQIKKHEEYKKLCMASKKKPTESIPEGYNLWDTVNDNNGFFACIYQKNNEMIIVYRSSDDINDWLDSNKSMLQGKMPAQAYNAVQVYDTVNKFCNENNMKLTILGYSLGGSLAQIVSAFRNAAAVTFNAYGVKNMLPKDLPYYNENNIINYCNEDDKITTMNAENHLGRCYSVKSKDAWKLGHFLENMGSLYEREETYGSYLQYKYEKEEHSQKEFEEYKKYGRRFIHMPGLSSDDNKSGCTGNYPVSSYTRSDGVKVDSYIRTCYKHGY